MIRHRATLSCDMSQSPDEHCSDLDISRIKGFNARYLSKINSTCYFN